MNKVILMGRLVRDPDVRYSNHGDSQLAIARYTVAVDRRRGRDAAESKADFISCVAFDRSAEFAERYLKKGMRILVEGRIQTGSYEKDGQRIYTTDVVVEQHEFCESKASQGNGEREESAPAQTSGNGFMNIPDDVDDKGLPFN